MYSYDDDLQSMVLQDCAKEIDVTCETLGISAGKFTIPSLMSLDSKHGTYNHSDPFNWSVPNVRAWLFSQLNHFNLPMVPFEYFQMDGISLCSLSEAEFKHRAGNQCGDILYAQLEIWKTGEY